MEQYYVRLRNQGNNLVTIHLDPIEVLLESTSPYLGILGVRNVSEAHLRLVTLIPTCCYP